MSLFRRTGQNKRLFPGYIKLSTINCKIHFDRRSFEQCHTQNSRSVRTVLAAFNGNERSFIAPNAIIIRACGGYIAQGRAGIIKINTTCGFDILYHNIFGATLIANKQSVATTIGIKFTIFDGKIISFEYNSKITCFESKAVQIYGAIISSFYYIRLFCQCYLGCINICG